MCNGLYGKTFQPFFRLKSVYISSKSDQEGVKKVGGCSIEGPLGTQIGFISATFKLVKSVYLLLIWNPTILS